MNIFKRLSTFVMDKIEAEDPIKLLPNFYGSMKRIAIKDATTEQKGACILATDLETLAGIGTACITPANLKAKLGDQTVNKVAVGKGNDQVLEYWSFFSSDDSITIDADIANKRFDIKIKSSEANKEPIVLADDSQLTLNRRHIVKAPLLKTINLSMDENPKVGDWIEIKNMDLGNFQINSGQNIDIVMNGKITRTKNGYIKSSKRGDFIRLECMDISPRIIFSDTANIGITIIL